MISWIRHRINFVYPQVCSVVLCCAVCCVCAAVLWVTCACGTLARCLFFRLFAWSVFFLVLFPFWQQRDFIIIQHDHRWLRNAKNNCMNIYGVLMWAFFRVQVCVCVCERFLCKNCRFLVVCHRCHLHSAGHKATSKDCPANWLQP